MIEWEEGSRDPFVDESMAATDSENDGGATTTIKGPFFFDGGSHSSLSSTLRDLQHLIRPMVHGMKTIFWCMSSYSHQRERERQKRAAAANSAAGGLEDYTKEEVYPLPAYALTRENDEVSSAGLKMTNGERELVQRFLVAGLPCLRVFTVNVSELERRDHFHHSASSSSSHNTSRHASPAKSHTRHREVLESFGVAFTSLESYNFRKVMAPHIQFMVDQLEVEENNIVLFSHLLISTGKAVSHEFVEVMLAYLMENIELLGEVERGDNGSDGSEEGARNIVPSTSSTTLVLLQPTPPPPTLTKRAQNLSRVWNLVLSSLIKYPRNEMALLPHLQTLIRECLQRCTEVCPAGVGGAAWPGPYLNTLRALFRTMQGGKFEQSYKEIMHLVPAILNSLHQMYLATPIPHFRFTIIELCLTIPSRLVTLLPHLPLLIQFITWALKSNFGDLINLGLRTLEFWIDSLHPDYLFPNVFAHRRESLCELMMALTSHLKPAPYPYGLLCMRLLGKLGGG
jgi:transformation/transcription domain-associated protein